MATTRHCCRDVIPFTAMVIVECTNVGLSTIFKAATLKGLSYHVFMTFSYAISALVMLPLCYIFHRKATLPPFTVGLLGRFFVLGILGFTAQYLGYLGIDYATPTLASAMSNLTPATTFVLAILFRMEKLALRSWSSQAKIMGTLVSIVGAFVVVLYKGPAVIKTQLPSFNLSAPVDTADPHWILGGGLLAAEYIIVSVWYIYQAKAVKEYPAEMVVVLFYNLSSFIISVPVGLISEPKLSAWIFKPDIRLISILYSGIMGSAFGTIVHTWGLHVKGPVYVALFRPLSIAIAAIMGVIFLGDNLYLGSIIGAFIISMGFYVVMWGKTQEETSDKVEVFYESGSSSSSESIPLLKGYADTSKEESLQPGA